MSQGFFSHDLIYLIYLHKIAIKFSINFPLFEPKFVYQSIWLSLGNNFLKSPEMRWIARNSRQLCVEFSSKRFLAQFSFLIWRNNFFWGNKKWGIRKYKWKCTWVCLSSVLCKKLQTVPLSPVVTTNNNRGDRGPQWVFIVCKLHMSSLFGSL